MTAHLPVGEPASFGKGFNCLHSGHHRKSRHLSNHIDHSTGWLSNAFLQFVFCQGFHACLNSFFNVLNSFFGCGAKNLALLQNQCKPSQLGKLINLIAGKKVHKGKNHSIKLWKYYFCTTTFGSVSTVL